MTDRFRDEKLHDLRSLDLRLTIDPGFVHKRRIQTILGEGGMSVVDDLIGKLPELPAWMREVRVDHIYTWVMLEFCRIHGVKTLDQALLEESGHLFCSTFHVEPCSNFYDVERAVSTWTPSFPFPRRVEFHYSTELVRADTLRSRLDTGTTVSMVGIYSHADEERIVFDPLVIGFPWLETDDPKWKERIMWFHYNFYENYLEDFDEFSRVKTVPLPDDFSAMQSVPEIGFKRALAKILGDDPKTDWGGETSDHYSSHLHLDGRRVTGAFLLKGPANFSPMTVRHLGKNGDQIIRLVQEPADVVFVQHCHEITPPIRTMLRALLVQPGRPRRYCCVDGRESLRLLEAFGLYEFAKAGGSNP